MLQSLKSILRVAKKRYLLFRRKPYFKILRKEYDSSTSFIANNCFGGRIPQDLGFKYNSPTEGLFIPYPDYIRFLSDLKSNTMGGVKLKKSSKYENINEYLKSLSFHVPIGEVGSPGKEVEIIFLHFHSDEEAIQKWKRRCARINFDKLMVFGSDNDGATEADAKQFLSLPYKNKFFFSAHHWNIPDSDEYCFIPEMECDGRVNGYEKAHIAYKYLCERKINR